MTYPDNFNAKLRLHCTNVVALWAADSEISESQKAWAIANLMSLPADIDAFLTIRVQARGVSFESSDEDWAAAVAAECLVAYSVRSTEYTLGEPQAVSTNPLHITRYAFRERFTAAEKIAIYTAAKTVPSIQIYLDDVNASTYIDLTRAATRAGVQALEAAQLLAAGRAAEILDTPGTDAEVWRGQ